MPNVNGIKKWHKYVNHISFVTTTHSLTMDCLNNAHRCAHAI